VKAVYTIGDSCIQVDLDLRELHGCRVVMIMNEQGANNFDSYRNTEGRFLERNAIGSWDEVLADEASFIGSKYGLSFKLYRAKEARMLRGWELMYNRLPGLAWLMCSISGRRASHTPLT
jgi:hypothetical protein